MVKVISTEKFREILDSFVQKEFMDTFAKLQVVNNRKFDDNEAAMLMKGFELGFLKGVNRIMDSFTTYKKILLDMQEEVISANVRKK